MDYLATVTDPLPPEYRPHPGELLVVAEPGHPLYACDVAVKAIYPTRRGDLIELDAHGRPRLPLSSLRRPHRLNSTRRSASATFRVGDAVIVHRSSYKLRDRTVPARDVPGTVAGVSGDHVLVSFDRGQSHRYLIRNGRVRLAD